MAKSIIYTPPQVAIKKLVCVMEQTGTNAPIVTVLENTLYKDATPLIATRITQGVYRVTANMPVFGPVFTSSIQNKLTNTFLVIAVITDQILQIAQTNQAGSPIDNLPNQTSFTVEVYNLTNKNY